MTKQQFVDKWSNHLAGKFSRFAFCETQGAGLDGRVRGMVGEIEKAVEKMWLEAGGREEVVSVDRLPALNGHANGTNGKAGVK